MSLIKTQILKNCPYPLLNFARKNRGRFRALKSALVKYNAFNGDENTAEAIKRGYFSVDEYLNRLVENGIDGMPRLQMQWAAAFEHYRKLNAGSPPIQLLWTDGPKPGNFGDWLSPYVISKLTRRSIALIDDYGSPGFKHLVAIGSLAPAINRNSYVLGTGAARRDSTLDPRARYFSVRGPYTASLLRDQGGPSIDNFGDLGFILSRLYKPKKIAVNAEFVLVRHMNHRHLPVPLPEGMLEISIEAASPDDVENFIDTIYSVGKVVTTAMHCFIACQSYKIPCALVAFEELDGAVYGDGIKYLDAMAGVEISQIPPGKLKGLRGLMGFDSLIRDDFVSDEMMAQVEQHARVSLASYLEE